MEIRALTGFDLETRQQYGRSYTPLNGTNTLLGVYYPEENFTTKELTEPDNSFVPANQNPNNFFVRYKKPLMVAGGIVATYLLYKRFK